MLREQAKLVQLGTLIADLVITAGAFIAAYYIRASEIFLKYAGNFVDNRPIDSFHYYYWALFIVIPLWLILLYSYGMYDSMRKKKYVSIAWIVVKTVFTGFIVTSMFIYFIDKEYFARGILLLFGALNLVALLAEKMLLRFLQRFFRARGFNYRRVLIVGTSKEAEKIASHVNGHPELGLRIVGFVNGLDDGPPPEDMNVVGNINEIMDIVDENVIDEVFFAVPYEKLKGIQDAIWSCEEVGVKVHITAGFINLLFSQTQINDFQGMPILTSSPVPNKALPLLVKRIIDIAVSGVMILILSPILIITAVIIKLTSRGSVFFSQARTGLNGRVFNALKFRSMKADAEKYRFNLEDSNEMDGPVFKIRHDPRITRFGRFIRKFSIDELPQLFNVLKGEMSLVGPRPLPVYEVAQFERWQRRRLSMKPGITCLWQVNGRNKITDFNEWMELDLEYIDNWSLGLDFKIILKTIPSVLLARGAS